MSNLITRLEKIETTLRACHTVKTPRNRFGANGHLRCVCEYVFVFEKS